MLLWGFSFKVRVAKEQKVTIEAVSGKWRVWWWTVGALAKAEDSRYRAIGRQGSLYIHLGLKSVSYAVSVSQVPFGSSAVCRYGLGSLAVAIELNHESLGCTYWTLNRIHENNENG